MPVFALSTISQLSCYAMLCYATGQKHLEESGHNICPSCTEHRSEIRWCTWLQCVAEEIADAELTWCNCAFVMLLYRLMHSLTHWSSVNKHSNRQDLSVFTGLPHQLITKATTLNPIWLAQNTFYWLKMINDSLMQATTQIKPRVCVTLTCIPYCICQYILQQCIRPQGWRWFSCMIKIKNKKSD